MQSTTTFRYAPSNTSPTRGRRHTMESPPRQPTVLRLVKASQQQQYAYQYMDDRGSFMRAQKAEEERIQQDIEQAQRAQRRNKARKVVRTAKAAHQTTPINHWDRGDFSPQPRLDQNRRKTEEREKSRLEHFKFPQLDTIRPAPPKKQSSSRHLAPLPPFNPFVRARSESLSSVIEAEPPAVKDARKWRRNASLSALFARIHREAGVVEGHGIRKQI